MSQYNIIYSELKSDIMNGTHAIGQVLPSENVLSREKQVARSTVRNALAQLEKEGFIEKRQGKGSVVISSKRAVGVLDYKGFTESVEDVNISTKSGVEPRKLKWTNDETADYLEKGQEYIHFARVRSIDNEPVMYELTYVPSDILKGLESKYKTGESFFDFLLKQYKLEITGMKQEIRAIAADKEVAKHLKLDPGSPVIHIQRKYSTTNPELQITSVLFCNTDKYSMSNDSRV